MALNGNARHIVCFGNEWHGDDGFGVRVHEALVRLAWPEDVKLFNAGIAGLGALRFLEDCRQAILVDALAGFGNVGEVYLFRPETMAGRGSLTSGHDLGIPYLLQALQTLRVPLPDILIVGAEIAAVEPFSPGLSATAERAVHKAVGLIQSVLHT